MAVPLQSRGVHPLAMALAALVLVGVGPFVVPRLALPSADASAPVGVPAAAAPPSLVAGAPVDPELHAARVPEWVMVNLDPKARARWAAAERRKRCTAIPWGR